MDIFVVETFYRPAEAWNEIWKYHEYYFKLIVVLPLLAVCVVDSFLPMGAYLYFLFGLEDTTFYGLQGYLPEVYWGVYVTGIWEPALQTVLALNVIGSILLVIYVIAIRKN